MRKIGRVVIPIFLVVVICFLTITTINQHFHKLYSGEIIKHAHPYEKNKTGNPFQEHHHSSKELIFLDKVSNTVFWINLFLILISPLFIINKLKAAPYLIFLYYSDHYFLKNYHAPPEISC